MTSKRTKVIHRKLGREQALGIAHIGKNKIELDERLKGKKYIEILIHEKIHLQNPEWSESKVNKHAIELTKVLWSNGIRWVDL